MKPGGFTIAFLTRIVGLRGLTNPAVFSMNHDALRGMCYLQAFVVEGELNCGQFVGQCGIDVSIAMCVYTVL